MSLSSNLFMQTAREIFLNSS